jgi:hypothetical protein
MSRPNDHEGIYALPPELDSLSSEELLQAFPFVWQPGLKINMWDAILYRSPDQDEAAQQALDERVRLVAKYCIMPPGVSSHINELLNWRTPELCQMLHDPAWEFPESTQELFEKQILKIPDGSELQRSWVHASGITIPDSKFCASLPVDTRGVFAAAGALPPGRFVCANPDRIFPDPGCSRALQ